MDGNLSGSEELGEWAILKKEYGRILSGELRQICQAEFCAAKLTGLV
jgi:hypothetical protein